MILGLVVVALCLYGLGRAVEKARGQPWAGPRTPQMRTRASRRPAPSGGGAWRTWHEAAAVNWLEKRRHARANGGTAPAPRRPRNRLRLRPQTVTTPPPQAGGNGNGESRPAPSPPPPAQPPPSRTTNGGTMNTGTSSAAGEKITEGANELHSHAAGGNINAKMEALAGASAGADRFSATMEMLGRTMSEPDNRYGPEITEPIVKSGAALRAATILIEEARANLESLANMTVRDLAESSRQAPHHSEMSENGSR